MKTRQLFKGKYRVVGIMNGDQCPAHSFLTTGEDSQKASRLGLNNFLRFVAANGLQQMPAPWSREVNKAEGIYEFKKGDLRLFFFIGKNGEIAVCCTGVLKQGQKVDKASVDLAVSWKKAYLAAIEDGTYSLIEEGEDVD